MNPNREHKNSVFTALFAAKEALIELYNALSNGSYPLDAKVEINTLQGILFLDAMNDISFILDGKFVILIEHQSTISENAPMRLLLYIARVYEKLIDRKDVYRQKLIKVPTPELIVLYNGKAPFPKEKILRLSDAFIEAPRQDGLGSLELVVRVININAGYNDEMISKSETLQGYVTFMEKIRENAENGMELGEAISEAVKYCERNNVLRTFLKEHASEVENMLTTEFVLADAIEVWREEGYEDGHEDGLVMGRVEGREEGRVEGLEEGFVMGREEGIQSILSLLEAGKSIGEIKEMIGQQNNIVLLDE